jgi:hypothetical protein
LPTGQPIKFPGFNVVRIGSGPWCTLYKPDDVSITAGDDIVVEVDRRLFSNANLPAAGILVDANPFALSVAGSPGSASCRITAGGSVWTFSDAAFRTSMVAALDLFLRKAEALEATVLRPGATEVLRALLAPRLPLTYAETLYVTHGVFSRDDTGQTYFDVRPGTRLRIDFTQCQFVPPNMGPSGLSGFVGGPTVTTDVVALASAGGRPAIGVDTFLSAVRLPPTGAAPTGFGDVVDLSAALATNATGRPAAPGMRHVRFCYPARSFPRADSGGNLSPAFNIAVLGAADLATLETATAAYYKTGDAGAQLLGFFRGRAVVQPLIPVLVDGSRRHFVPVGTTVRQLLEWFAPVPRLPGFVNEGMSTFLQRRRMCLDVGSLYGAGYAPVVLADAGLDRTGADALDAPVLAADRLTSPPGVSGG